MMNDECGMMNHLPRLYLFANILMYQKNKISLIRIGQTIVIPACS